MRSRPRGRWVAVFGAMTAVHGLLLLAVRPDERLPTLSPG